MTENTRILWASGESVEKRRRGEKEEERDLGTGRETTPFAAAYLDFSRGPETELWIYSSLEHRLYTKTDTNTGTGEGEDKGKAGGPNEQEKDLEREEIACAVCLLGEVKRQQDLYFVPGSPEAKTRVFPTVLVGNLNEVLRERLASPSPSGGGMKIASTGLYDILFFRVDDLPDIGLPEVLLANGEGEEEGRRWSWDDIRREDIAFTISRTHIHREEYVFNFVLLLCASGFLFSVSLFSAYHPVKILSLHQLICAQTYYEATAKHSAVPGRWDADCMGFSR
jgi:hypothetical protein